MRACYPMANAIRCDRPYSSGTSTARSCSPAVQAVLAWLTDDIGRIAGGLGTGNVKRGAYAKLARGSLDTTFGFGSFGCDAEDRTELLRVGAERGAAALGLPSCVGVGTGGFEPRVLLELGAHHAFETLEHDGVREALVGR